MISPRLRTGCRIAQLSWTVPNSLARTSRRTFLSSSSQTLNATRTLPYSRQSLYGLIADIQSYPHFLPYCLEARVLDWSLPDSRETRWPAAAELTVGWGSIQERYLSKVHCVPGRVVESLAGDAQTRLSPQDRELYAQHEQSQRHAKSGDIFKSLRSTWTLHDSSRRGLPEATDVELEILFEFQNPVYAALAGAAVPKVAGTVMEAFEKRASQVLSSAAGTR